ncbi:hypothetical protein BJX63DRAFT_437642 [Aspergillus granulosus]|uniref:Uncharacterized protein n=1 Tax=Aspergillus granulosus TaxID=176169 RepID=A0ABR4GW15_9EURO
MSSTQIGSLLVSTHYSQAQLTLAGEYIFTINSGSNTLSMLMAHHQNLSLLSLIGELVTIPSGFPTNATASFKNNLISAATTNTEAGRNTICVIHRARSLPAG